MQVSTPVTTPSPAILYTSPTNSTILLDIPSSLSAPPGLTPRCFHTPLEIPHTLQEPKTQTQTQFTQDLAHIHTRLLPSLLAALKDIHSHYNGPYCYSRTQDESSNLSQELDFHTGIYFLQPPDTAEDKIILDESTTFSDISDILSFLVTSPHSSWSFLELSHPHPSKTFHIPPNSSFLLSSFQSSITTFTALAREQGQFDFILLDPPWPNRSAVRSSAYETLSRFDTKDLLQLPLGRVLAYPRTHEDGGGYSEGGLVGVWITNKPKFRKFVIETLFPSWGVQMVGEWLWLKITTKGEPMFSLESCMRKPYEALIFGRRIKSPKGEKKRRRVPEEDGGGPRHCGGGSATTITQVPTKVILAVPDLHSRKPCIKELIEPYLPSSYRACEIFGRNLTKGWLTWGDEALRFNWKGYWKERDKIFTDSQAPKELAGE